MHRSLLIFSSLVLAFTAIGAANPEYPREVQRWQEVILPREDDEYRLTAWFSAASTFSKSYEWRVFAEHGKVCAQLASELRRDEKERPSFEPKTDEFSTRPETALKRVEDGWLVGFNNGEFGGALYWFSADGKQNYKISDHQVVDFFTSPDGLHAIEGLGHMGESHGSVIRMIRPNPDERWRASTVVELPDVDPCAVSTRSDGTVFITSPHSIISVRRGREVTTLLQDPWWHRPTSSVLSPDEQKLYLGMKYVVAEFDIATKKLRLLVPSDSFLQPYRISEQRMREHEAKNNMRFYRRPPRK